jgi:hypothetical protein
MLPMPLQAVHLTGGKNPIVPRPLQSQQGFILSPGLHRVQGWNPLPSHSEHCAIAMPTLVLRVQLKQLK